MEAAQHTWAQQIINSAPSLKGCFHMKYPSTTWQSEPCHALGSPPPSKLKESRSKRASTVADYILKAPDGVRLKRVIGSFPQVKGVKWAKSTDGENDGLDSYSLQLNTNYFTDPPTPLCTGRKGCQIWQQFGYQSDLFGPGSARMFIVYWINNYGGKTCPDGWSGDGSTCLKTEGAAANAVYVPAYSARTTATRFLSTPVLRW
ncbi:hypothetical protein [Bordetella sp. H567]|uniref:hypothetical protein n=1 Tax=Bordetella sp. H567 TaxID=1697043 RepID=UPI0011AB3102|nr:hypothetical protein [Bordetella sp. H567]